MFEPFEPPGPSEQSTSPSGPVPPESGLRPAESLDPVFRPRSVAIVGASRRPGSIGREILNNLVTADFTGPVFPVNPKEGVLRTLKCFPHVEAIPDPVDLAVIVVPRDEVIAVVEACARKGIRGLVVITAGFKEVGGEGLVREQRLREIVRSNGMRMIGPNCMGILNTDRDVRLNASFATTPALPGEVSLMTQSGALGEVILNHAAGMRVGFSMFASMGNKTDISGNDLLLYWEDDPHTRIILLYIESFGNPRRFSRIARRITRTKPIIAVKSGRTAPGARAASSHTGALAGSDLATDALFDQCGVLRAGSVPEMFELALAMTTQPCPRGRRVAIVTNAGGPGILAADACANTGLTLVEFEPATRAALRAALPDECSIGNPVDLLASAGPERYEVALEIVLRDPSVDALLVIFVPPVMINAPLVARAIHAASAAHREIPVLGCFMGQQQSFPDLEEECGIRVPFYPYPEEAVRCLDRMARYAALRVRPEGKPFEAGLEVEAVRTILNPARAKRRCDLLLSESLRLAEAAGVAVVPWRWVPAGADARARLAAAGASLGYPVVVKGDVPAPVHKTERGLVALRLDGEGDLIAAALAMEPVLADPAVGGTGWVVQRQAHGGREMLLGMVHDPVFGSILALGFGGTQVEGIRDVVFRLNPITDVDARAMIGGLRGQPLLDGFRGEPPIDREALMRTLGRLSRLVEEVEDLEEMDWNPVVFGAASPEGLVLDARVRLRC